MSCSSSHPPEKSTILPWHDPRTRTGEKCLRRQNNWKLPLMLQPTPSKKPIYPGSSSLQARNVTHTHTSLFKCIHINVISMKNPPEALSRSCTSSTWQINQSTHLFGVPYVVIPPWTRLQIQISDPLDVLRWSHHLPLGIANQLHHILSCGGENPCWPSKFQLSKAQTPQSPVLSLALWPVNSLRLHPKKDTVSGRVPKRFHRNSPSGAQQWTLQVLRFHLGVSRFLGFKTNGGFFVFEKTAPVA